MRPLFGGFFVNLSFQLIQPMVNGIEPLQDLGGVNGIFMFDLDQRWKGDTSLEEYRTQGKDAEDNSSVFHGFPTGFGFLAALNRADRDLIT